MPCYEPGPLLREVARLHVQLQKDRVCGCCDATDMQCSILMELGRNPLQTLADLTKRLELDKGWVSRAVDVLCKDGLVRKDPGQTDRRTVRLSMTEEGERRRAAINGTLNRLVERVLAHIPADDRPLVERSLQLLLTALQEEIASGVEKECGCVSETPEPSRTQRTGIKSSVP